MSLLTGGLTDEELDKNVVHRVTIGQLRQSRNGSVASARGYPRTQPTALLYLVAAPRGLRVGPAGMAAGVSRPAGHPPTSTRPFRG